MLQVKGAWGKGWPTHPLLVPTRAAETGAAGKGKEETGYAHKQANERAVGNRVKRSLVDHPSLV